MKKALSLMLVLVLVLGMSTTAFALAKDKSNVKLDPRGPQTTIEATSGNTGYTLVYDVMAGRGGGGTWESEIVDFSTPGITIKSGLVSSPANALGYDVNGAFTKEDITSAKVTLKTVITKGAKAFDGTAYWAYEKDDKGKERLNARVAIDFNEWFTNNNPDGIEYEVKIYLVVEGRQWQDSGITIEGDYYNLNDTYYEVTDGSVYMGDGTIITADGYMKSVEMDLSEGVFAYGKMFKDRNYYGVADIEVYDKDEEFMDKYELDAVYHINEAGLKAVVEYVTLENEDSTSYVYTVGANGKLAYVGKGDDELPLLATYYLSTKELTDLDEEIEPDEGEIPSDEIEKPVDGGGDDFYPENANDNPGTGC